MGDNLAAQWQAVTNAPLIYGAGLLALAGLVWWFVDMFYKNRIEGLKEDVARSRERRDPALFEEVEKNPKAVPQPSLTKTVHENDEPPTLREKLIAVDRPEPESQRVTLPAQITLRALHEACTEKTTLEAQRALAPYLGKWIHTSGTVFDVQHDSFIGWNALLWKEGESASASLYFDQSQASKVETLRRGIKISVFGQIDKIERDSVLLKHCVIE